MLALPFSHAGFPLTEIEVLVVVVASTHPMSKVILPKSVILILLQLICVRGDFSLLADVYTVALADISVFSVFINLLWGLLLSRTFCDGINSFAG